MFSRVRIHLETYSLLSNLILKQPLLHSPKLALSIALFMKKSLGRSGRRLSLVDRALELSASFDHSSYPFFHQVLPYIFPLTIREEVSVGASHCHSYD